MISAGDSTSRAQRELLRLRHLQLAEQVGAVGDGHAVTLADFERLQGAVDDEVVLGQHVRTHAVFGGMLLHLEIGDEIGDQEHALFGHQLCGRIVDQIAVLDGAHAGIRRARDRFRRIGVSTDIAAKGVRLLHGRLDLADRELQAVERIVGRSDAAGHHDLHLVAALAHFLAHRAADLGNAVGDAHGERHGVAAMTAHAEVGAAAAVAMAAGRADRASGDEQPRSRQQPFVGRFLQAPIGAAGVAHAGEAAVEHPAHQLGGARRHQRQRHVLHVADHDLGQHHMHMAVDQAGHQRAPAAVDDVGRSQA